MGAIVVVAVPAAPPSAAAACGAWSTVPSPNLRSYDMLAGVAATSPTNAWAVGTSVQPSPQRTVILRWNGSTWNLVSSPNAVGNSSLNAVAAAGMTAWAVGRRGTFEQRSLIERWNGSSWQIVASPNIEPSVLTGVTMVPGTSQAWAVGGRGDLAGTPLIERWNGAAWQVFPAPQVSASQAGLSAVTALSSTNAWAVGYYFDTASASKPLALRWNGTAWRQWAVPSPAAAENAELTSISAVSANNIWAAGRTWNGLENRPFTAHWNGYGWRMIAGPHLVGAKLFAVSASAAGVFVAGQGPTGRPLIARRTGTGWSVETSPAPAGAGNFRGLAAVPGTTEVWAVGGVTPSASKSYTLIDHRC